jgi:hypothetical protein
MKAINSECKKLEFNKKCYNGGIRKLSYLPPHFRNDTNSGEVLYQWGLMLQTFPNAFIYKLNGTTLHILFSNLLEASEKLWTSFFVFDCDKLISSLQ